MVEWHTLELERFAFARLKLFPWLGEFEGVQCRTRLEIRQHHGVFKAGQGCLDLGHGVQPLEGLAAITVAVDSEENLGRDLLKTVDDVLGTKLGRADRPCGPDTHGRKERDDCLGRVGHVCYDTVALAHAQPSQARRHRCYSLAKFAVRDDREWLAFSLEHHGRMIIVPCQHSFRVV